MKLLSITVPCYNSQDYMEKCIDSLLVGGEDVEIIIIDDGSKDSTGAIADSYAEKYPTIVKVVHQPNGGHGEGINQGIANATGLFFKVVDSDDFLEENALKTLLETIKVQIEKDEVPDVFVTNFVYNKEYKNERYISHYRKFFKPGMQTWDNIKPFRLWHLMLMHALCYKTEVLHKSGIVLPKHTFYEDNYFAFMPLPHTKTLYYLDVDLYWYLIGRADQSVTITNIVKKYDSQLRVQECMINAYTMDEINALPKGLKRYMKHMLRSIIANTYCFTCGEDTPERRAGLKHMWETAKKKDMKLYRFLRNRTYAMILKCLPWKLKGFVALQAYKMLCRIVKLG